MTTGIRWTAPCMLLVVAVMGACRGDNPTTPTSATSPAQFATYTSTHFAIRHTPADAATVAQTAAAVEGEFDRITSDLAVTMPPVTITLYPSVEALRVAVAPLVGTLPSFATGLVTAVDAIHIVSPTRGPSYSAGVISIVHEFTHCASMRVQANIANNPRWLWETVALYEAGQFVDPMTLPLLNGAAPPTLQQLNSLDNTMIYSIGASLGRFIVQTWGADAFRALIRSNGNTAITLGLADSDLIDRWFQHAKNSLSE